MTARSTPYPPADYRVRVPQLIWTAALNEVRRYASLDGRSGRRGSEGLVYLGGVPTTEELLVTSVFRLHHLPQGDSVKPTPAEVRWLLLELRARDEKLVAQLHTHRHGARHSPGDDAMATSFHPGFLSIVVPNFAVGVAQLHECIVHEYRDGEFGALTPAQVAARFNLSTQAVDRTADHEGEVPSRWPRFVQRLKSIVPRRR
jgi:hypothetical protein